MTLSALIRGNRNIEPMRVATRDISAIEAAPVALDSYGLPFLPCPCGCHYFWRPAGGIWRCYDCQPYADPLHVATTCTLSRGFAVVADSTPVRHEAL